MNPALSINTIGNTLSLNIHNCHYTHDTVASSYKNVVRLVGGAIRASIDSVDAVNLDTLFIVTTESYMNISNITMNGCNSLVDDLANTAVITIGNNIVITNPVSGAQAIIHRMYGKLINNNPNIVHPSSQSITSTDFVEYSGDLIDSCDPMSYDVENVTGSNGTIRVTGISNKYFNITGTSNITTIEGGMNGQRILLKASSNISIVASTEITLQSSTVTIGPYNSIELKRIANDWVQIK